jgi:PHP family Zn ribbon phosphoesterase
MNYPFKVLFNCKGSSLLILINHIHSPQTSSLSAIKNDPKQEMTNVRRGRLIVFVAGGITYGETKAVYEIMKEKHYEIFLGLLN